jgi:hypothetical protein
MTGAIEPHPKAGLLERIHAEHASLEALLAQLDEDQMTQPAVVGGWSIKDILAHITAWEKCMLQWMAETRQGLIPRLPASKHDLHRWNVRFYQQNQARSLADVLAEFYRSYQEVLHWIAETPEEELVKEIHGAWPKGPLWQGIADNTWGHYKEHAASIRKWMRKNI